MTDLIWSGCSCPGLFGGVMTQEQRWQLDGTAAELYQRYLVPAITAQWAADLIERAAPQTGERILDVACGTGVVARLAAERIRTGRVVGLDLNTGMLAVARSLPSGAGPDIEWFEGNVLDLSFEDRTFDLVTCQLGLQFFPDRAKALQEIHRVLVPNGRLALSVYSAIERTPVAQALANALDQHLGPGASVIKRSEHSLSDPNALERVVRDQGFHDLSLQAVIMTIRFDSPRDYVRLQIAATPMADLVNGMSSEKREVVIDRITTALMTSLGQSAGSGELCSPQEAFVVLARR